MSERRCRSMRDYVGLLLREPQEVDRLISAMLIKVTSFFRDPDIWDAITNEVLPKLLSRRRNGDPLRIWCAGCATGEEAYSIAMLLAEQVGPDLAAAGVKVFATDVDDASVAYGRRGIYTPRQVEGLAKSRLAQWFTPAGEGFEVRKELRRGLVFGSNNLVSDAPISNLHLLFCRNVFIYLDATLQKRVLTRFHYALRRDGVLVLGKSELIPLAAKLFEPVSLSRRIYRKDRSLESALRPDLLPAHADAGDNAQGSPQAGADHHVDPLPYREVVAALALPTIATGLDGTVVAWNPAAERLWGRAAGETVGKRLATLGLAGLTGNLLIEKTNSVRQGKSEREIADGSLVREAGHPPTSITVELTPVRDQAGEVIGLCYVALDISAFRGLESDLRRSNEERQSAYEELQTTNEELQSANEELETTNEELQSANEELQTTNEELQSTNEELETTNEELQSTNAELDATNRELAHRTEELNLLGFYQRTIIRSLAAAVAVLDIKETVTSWNLAAERLFGVTESEAVGRSLSRLHLPTFKRPVLTAIRRSLAERKVLRINDLPYQLPTGAAGYGNLAVLPLVDGEYLGAVLTFEDNTRVHSLAAEVDRLTARVRQPPSRSGGRGLLGK
jgi:two-component system CheB/CheR fusion protein